MCGRSRCALAPERVEEAAGVQRERWVDRGRYRPSYNVSPGAWTPIIRLDEQHAPQLQTMRWGLVPSFTKPGEKPDFWRMFNARSESVAEKPVFSRLLKRQRCVVLLEGFYEWKTDAGGKKQPYYCSFGEGNLMKMAGLYDTWAGGPEGPLTTYTILTTDAAPRLTWLHNRMPVILPDDDAVAAWLGSGMKPAGAAAEDKQQEEQQAGDEEQQQQEEEQKIEEQGAVKTEHKHEEHEGTAASSALSFKSLDQICQPFNGDSLMWHPVTPEMSKPSYDCPDASRDVRTKKGSISTFFSKPGKPAAGKAAAAAVASKDIKPSPSKAAAKASTADRATYHEQQQQQQHREVEISKEKAGPQQQQQQQKAAKGIISSFFKPVASPAKQQQSKISDAARNPDEQAGPSTDENTAAEKAAGHDAGSKRSAEDGTASTPAKRARA